MTKLKRILKFIFLTTFFVLLGTNNYSLATNVSKVDSLSSKVQADSLLIDYLQAEYGISVTKQNKTKLLTSGEQKFIELFKDIEKDNVKVLLNNSFSMDKGYFSLFDIKNVIKHNVDYTLNQSFYIKDIDRYIMEGHILILNKHLSFRDVNDYNRLVMIAKNLVEGDVNE